MASIEQPGRAIDAAREEPREAEAARVTPLELFFDLVFVFAITQVTQLIADRPTFEGLAQAMILLALVWWPWVGFAWLTDALETDQDRVRVGMFVAMIAMFVVSLSIPDAFGDKGLLLAVGYVGVRVAHLVLFSLQRGVGRFHAVRSLGPTTLVACVLVLGASFLDGPLQGAVFLAAITLDYLGGTRGIDGWTLHPGYFAERHGLIMIVAFGESIVATGIGAKETALGSGEILAGGLAIALIAAMWWAYFDVVAIVAEKRLHAATPGRAQNALARDVYSYLHLVFIAAIVLVALGSKKTIAHVEDPLKLVPAIALCGGIALYLLGHILVRLRTIGTLNRQRLLTALLAAALIPVGLELPALATLTLLTALTCALVAYEAVRFGAARTRVRGRPPVTR